MACSNGNKMVTTTDALNGEIVSDGTHFYCIGTPTNKIHKLDVSGATVETVTLGGGVLFSSNLFHSRALPENYGEGLDGRLIHVCFGSGELT